MALTYILDEHLRRLLWQAIQRHNAAASHLAIDVAQVGDPVDLPLGSTDPDILPWAENEGRIVVTRDRKTMLGDLAAHLQSGHHCARLFVLRSKATIQQIIDYLVLAAYAADPAVLHDRYEYIP
ncbi:MAG: DUF5615 family PIN-like protein [Gemmataceae bacterium]